MTTMAPGAIAIDCGTMTAGWIATLAGEAQARTLRFLEAPVTGSRDQAAAGALRFLVGGQSETLDAARPVFEAMGSAVLHLGPVGSAAIVKLANNFLCGVQAAALAEAVALLEKKGLDIEQAVGVLTDGAPGSPLVKAMSRRMLERTYDPHFVIPLMAKDLAYAAEAMAGVGITSTIAQTARARYIEAEQAGLGERDVSAIVEPLRQAPMR